MNQVFVSIQAVQCVLIGQELDVRDCFVRLPLWLLRQIHERDSPALVSLGSDAAQHKPGGHSRVDLVLPCDLLGNGNYRHLALVSDVGDPGLCSIAGSGDHWKYLLDFFLSV